MKPCSRWSADKRIVSSESREARSLTLYEDLGDFGVAGTESAVDFKTVCIVEEGASEGEENLL